MRICNATLSICPRSKEATSHFLAGLHIGLLQIHAQGLNIGKESASASRSKRSKYSSLGQRFSYSYKGLKSSRNKRFSQHKGHCLSSLIITPQTGKALSPLFHPGFSTQEKQETRTRKRAKRGCGYRLARLLPLQLCQSPSPKPWPRSGPVPKYEQPTAKSLQLHVRVENPPQGNWQLC